MGSLNTAFKQIFRVLFWLLLITLFLTSRPTTVSAQGCGVVCGLGGACNSGLTCGSPLNINVCQGASCEPCVAFGDPTLPSVCTAPLACPPNWIGGNTCASDPNLVCCAEPATSGDGGTGTCGDPCADTTDCADTPYFYLCSSDNLCYHDNVCHPCIGDSGTPGVCLIQSTCASLGRNYHDGNGSGICPATTGGICCTDAPMQNLCSFTGIPSTLTVGQIYTFSFSGNPNSTYYASVINSTGTTTLICWVTPSFTTNASGTASNLSIRCDATGNYTVEVALSIAPTIPVCDYPFGVQNCPPGGCGGPGSPGSGTIRSLIQIASPNFTDKSIGDIIGILLPYLFAASGLLLTIFILYGGFTLMLSRGDPGAVAKGKGILSAAFIGLVIAITAYWIIQLTGEFFDIRAIKDIF
jgi:hypothetical protein